MLQKPAKKAEAQALFGEEQGRGNDQQTARAGALHRRNDAASRVAE